jgi:hypothetical protein
MLIAALGLVALIAIGYVAMIFSAHRWSPDSLAIDSCLDRGGKWNYATRNCER